MPSTQSRLLPYLIMFTGLMLGYFYNSGADPAGAVPPVPVQFQITTLRALSSLTIDYSVLTSDQFTSLRVFGSMPVPPNASGKSDLFQ